MSKLHDFAQAVGADIKEIKASIASKTVGVSEERLTQANYASEIRHYR